MTTTIVGGVIGVLGVVLGVALTWAQQRFAAKSAARGVAASLFTQVVKAIALMETERALFWHRRESRHANFIALGNVAMQALAAKTSSGNWASGFASGLGGMTAWDANEGARFTDRYFAARAEATAALVQLSLMSEGLQQACGNLGKALDARAIADGQRRTRGQKADDGVEKAVSQLRSAVCDYRG